MDHIKKISLIIGAQKSGTTSLFNYLSEHPQVCPSHKKEPFFFADDTRYGKGTTSYFALWDWQDEHSVAIEASAAYTMRPIYSHVAERIARLKDIEFSFVYIMRNPLQRIESHIIHALSTGALKRPGVTDDSISVSKYAYQLDPFAEIFGRERLHLLLLENLQSSPRNELQRIYRFLGVDSCFEGTGYTRVYNNKQESHFRLPPRLRRLYEAPILNSTLGRLPKSFRRSLYKYLPQSNPPEFKLSEPERHLIFQQLQPDLARLKKEYKVDFEEQWNMKVE